MAWNRARASLEGVQWCLNILFQGYLVVAALCFLMRMAATQAPVMLVLLRISELSFAVATFCLLAMIIVLIVDRMVSRSS